MRLRLPWRLASDHQQVGLNRVPTAAAYPKALPFVSSLVLTVRNRLIALVDALESKAMAEVCTQPPVGSQNLSGDAFRVL